MYPYDLDPYSSALVRSTVREQLPQYTPEEESSLLGNLMEGSLGGLSFLGKVLDKTFGGRAARGLLGGKPQELLSVLPLSDTLGITNEADTVQGRDLLDNLGATTRGTDSTWNDIAGMGAEIALDPATWVGAAVPRMLAKAGGSVGRNVLAPASTVAGMGFLDPYAAVTRVGSNMGDWLGRQGRALFDPSVAGATTGVGQEVGRRYTSMLDQLNTATRNQATKARQAGAGLWRELGATPDVENALLTGARQYVEALPSAADATLGQIMTPQQMADFKASLDPLWQETDRLLGAQQSRGIKALDTDDEAIAHFPRSLAELPGLSTAERLTNPRAVGSQLSGVHSGLKHRKEFLRDIPGGTEEINRLAMDPQLSGPTASMTPLQAEAYLAHRYAGTAAESKATDIAEYLRELRPGYAADQKPLFNKDIYSDFQAYGEKVNRAMSSAEAVQFGIEKFAEPVAAIEARGQRYVRVPDLLERTGLNYTTGGNTNINVAMQNAAQRRGVNINDLRGLAMPEDVAADMLRIGQAWRNPAAISPVINAWDKAVNLFKTYVTRVFPAFHVRNLGSGIFNMWRDDAVSLSAMGDAWNMIRGGAVHAPLPGQQAQNAAEATQETLRELISQRIAFTPNRQTTDVVGGTTAPRGGVFGQIPEMGGTPKQTAAADALDWAKGIKPKSAAEANPLNVAGVASATDVFAPVRQATALGDTVEDFVRASHYIALRQKGMAPADAAKQVLKYHIDYAHGFTEFERNVAKRMFPWWSFSSRTLPVVLEELATNPAKLAAAARVIGGSREPGEFVPNYIAEGASVPIPGAPEGYTRFISSFGTPLEDESLKALGSLAQGDIGRALQQVIGMSQPFIKAPIEVATGRQFHSGRRLEELRPYEFATLGGLLPEDRARQLSQLIAGTPLSRAASSLNQLFDERKGTGTTLLNLASGVKVTDVDVEKQKEIASRELLKDMLRGQSGVRSREDVYVPRELIPTLDPYEQQLLGLLKSVERQVRDRSNEKASQK